MKHQAAVREWSTAEYQRVRESSVEQILHVARDEMARTGVTVPLFVSHRSLLERVGPLGRAWRTIDGSEPGFTFARR